MEFSINHSSRLFSPTPLKYQKRSFLISLLAHCLLIIMIVRFSPKFIRPQPSIHKIITATLYDFPTKPISKTQKIAQKTIVQEKTAKKQVNTHLPSSS
ncbi:cell envelope integrity protein TolA [Colwelliaceae bacterium 6441]